MSFLAYIMIQVGMKFEIDKTDLRKYGIVYLVAMASRILSTGRLQIARQQLTYLAICNLPYAAHLSKTNLFRSPAAGIRLALRVLQISQFYLRSDHMADVLLIVTTVLFFIVSWLYVIGCDRL